MYLLVISSFHAYLIDGNLVMVGHTTVGVGSGREHDIS